MDFNLVQALTTGDLSALADHPLMLNGRKVMYVGLTATIYFHLPFAPNINEQICQCIEDYLSLASVPPTLGGLPGRRQWTDFSKRPFVRPREATAKLGKDAEWDFTYTWTKTDEEAAPWYLEIVRSSSVAGWALGYFHVTFPVNWMLDEHLPARIKTWSERLDVFHGYVGLSLLTPSDQIASTKLDGIVYAAAKQFPGLNVDYPSSHSGVLLDGIKTVDWLTMLGKPFVEKLGGLASLQHQLLDFQTVPLTTGGLLIQACKLPQLGDAGNGDPMKPYKGVNRILKPVRVVDYPYSFQSGQAFQSGQTTEPYMDRAAARAWIARFDDKP